MSVPEDELNPQYTAPGAGFFGGGMFPFQQGAPPPSGTAPVEPASNLTPEVSAFVRSVEGQADESWRAQAQNQLVELGAPLDNPIVQSLLQGFDEMTESLDDNPGMFSIAMGQAIETL